MASQGFEPADCGRPRSLPTSRLLKTGRFHVDGTRAVLPVTISFRRGPSTYTGQDLVEIHTLGSPPLLNLLLAHMLAQGARLAEPGEFTFRAFASGRLDLTQAEAVLEVIEADRPERLTAALLQLAGGLAKPILEARDRLLDVLAHVEAGLDFVDEPDVNPIERDRFAQALLDSKTVMINLLSRLSSRDRSGRAPRVVLQGPPNAGKSRLFNALIGRETAIVSPIAGTTRDFLSAFIVCDGLTIELIDTAGDESARDEIERSAQSQRSAQVADADLLLVCASFDTLGREVQSPNNIPSLALWTKVDIALREAHMDAISVSAATMIGLEELRRGIAHFLRGRRNEDNQVFQASARCRESLTLAVARLEAASAALHRNGGDEFVAVDIREAVDELGKVVGFVATDDILDRIFSRFCIGK